MEWEHQWKMNCMKLTLSGQVIKPLCCDCVRYSLSSAIKVVLIRYVRKGTARVMLIQAAIIKSDHVLFWSTRHSPAPSGSFLSPPSPLAGPCSPHGSHTNTWREHLLGVKIRAGASWSCSVAGQDEIHIFPQPLSLKTSRFCYLLARREKIGKGREHERIQPIASESKFWARPRATRLQQDFGEMASLCQCGSFHEEQTPPRRDPPTPKMNPGSFCLGFFFSFPQKKYSSQSSVLRHSLKLAPYFYLT